MKRFVLGVALAAALAAPAHSAIIYNFVQTAEGGTYAPFSGVTMQLALSDAAAGASSVAFKQVGNGGMNPATTTGSGIEQFGMFAVGREQFGSAARLPMTPLSSQFEVNLTSLIGGGLGGLLNYFGQGDTLTAAYDSGSGLWHGNFAADYLSPCGARGSCTFSGYFQLQVPEPATLAILGVSLLALIGWRRFGRAAV